MKATKQSFRATQMRRFRAWVKSLPKFDVHPGELRFWRDSFLVFVVAGIVGHVVDLLWRVATDVPLDLWIWQLLPVISLHFGFSALALLWFVYPLTRSRKIGPVLTFLFGAIVTTFVELICGLFLMALNGGANPYWSYYHLPFNLFGQICLSQSIVIGVVSLAAVYFMIPWLITKLKQLNNVVLYAIAAILVGSCLASIVIYFASGIRIVI